MKQHLFVAAVLATMLISSVMTLSFSNALGNDMVLQRSPSQARVWGSCEGVTNCEVKVIFLSQTFTTSINTATNYWQLYLPPMPAGGPYNITAQDTDGNEAALLNILFGDVFVCSGQSNMEMTVIQSLNATENIAKAANYRNVRLFTVGQGTTSSTPLNEFNTIEQRWVAASPETVGGPDYTVFSGVCWYFATYLYMETQIPIGLVSSNWGGTSVQQWSSPAVMESCSTTGTSVLWNAMISPLLPMSIKGVLWYQGESNIGQSQLYSCLFPAMISDWRNNWQNSGNINFGFYFVMLAPYLVSPGDVQLPMLRQSQLSALELPNVGMGSAIDLGDLYSPYGDIHPRDKEGVGYRLQLQALSLTYKQTLIIANGPMVRAVVRNPTLPSDSGFEVSATITFRSESLGTGLKFVENYCPDGITDYCGWYDLQIDSVWYNSTARISADRMSLIISLEVEDGTAIVQGVRYGYADWPVATLYNDDDLPATPFSISLIQ